MEGRGITNGRMGISNSSKGNSAREREGEVGERTELLLLISTLFNTFLNLARFLTLDHVDEVNQYVLHDPW